MLEITFNKQFFSHVFKNVRPWQTDQPLMHLKGALDNFSLIPQFFFPTISIPLEVCTYVMTECLIFLAAAIFKSF